MLFTCIGDGETVVKRRGAETCIPNVVHTYLKIMTGVDRSDHISVSFLTKLKRVKKL